MHPYLKPLTTQFEQNADPAKAEPMQQYMRDQFPFLGIKAPDRQALVREFLQEYGLPPLSDVEAISRELWAMPQREYQYAAMDILERLRKKLTAEFTPLLEYLIVSKSWWDTVDLLASHNVGTLFFNYPEVKDKYVAQWRISDNMWLRRTTLLFQLGYKDNTDADLLFALIGENLDSKEFFIQKAIGWALREYSKTDDTAVIHFVQTTNLAPLSQREALKWLNRK